MMQSMGWGKLCEGCLRHHTHSLARMLTQSTVQTDSQDPGVDEW